MTATVTTWNSLSTFEILLVISSASAVVTFASLLLNIVTRRRIPIVGVTITERVAVMIPMRNEEANAAQVVMSVLEQRGLNHCEVIVCDDHSTDATADALAAFAEDPRVRVISGADLPDGWLGKPWACQQLRAAAGNAQVLVFIDADVRLHPRAVASSIAALRKHNLSLVSPFPRQLYRGFWLSLFQPMLQWSILAMLPLRIMELRARWKVFASLAAANGQFLVIDAGDYDRASGHESVRGEVVEDVMLARSIKAAGGKVTLTAEPGLSSCRMYEGTSDFVIGYTKSMWAAFGSPLGGLSVVAVFWAQYLLPWVGVFASPIGGLAWWTCLAAIAAGIIGRLVAAAVVRDALWPALLHTLSILVFSWLMFESLRRKATGRLQWKGRALA